MQDPDLKNSFRLAIVISAICCKASLCVNLGLAIRLIVKSNQKVVQRMQTFCLNS